MATTSIVQAEDFYNMLLEAERAGVAVIEELVRQNQDPRFLERFDVFSPARNLPRHSWG